MNKSFYSFSAIFIPFSAFRFRANDSPVKMTLPLFIGHKEHGQSPVLMLLLLLEEFNRHQDSSRHVLTGKYHLKVLRFTASQRAYNNDGSPAANL